MASQAIGVADADRAGEVQRWAGWRLAFANHFLEITLIAKCLNDVGLPICSAIPWIGWIERRLFITSLPPLVAMRALKP